MTFVIVQLWKYIVCIRMVRFPFLSNYFRIYTCILFSIKSNGSVALKNLNAFIHARFGHFEVTNAIIINIHVYTYTHTREHCVANLVQWYP